MTNEVSMIIATAAHLQSELERGGPRAGADLGDPQTSGLVLHSGPPQVGVWECTPGGWAIESRGDTESGIVLQGRARLTGADGQSRQITAGDVYVLPKGWSGRWEILEALRKVYVVV
jgi:uncharacterized cupin superfamily protein